MFYFVLSSILGAIKSYSFSLIFVLWIDLVWAFRLCVTLTLLLCSVLLFHADLEYGLVSLLGFKIADPSGRAV
jgi:hypothetical protein